MDLLLDICRGLGLALAAGMAAATVFALVLGSADSPARRIGVLLAGVGGALAFYAALNAAERTAWPGVVIGALAGLFAATAINEVLVGASQRAGGSLVGVSLMALGAALLLAAISAVLPPVALIAAAAIGWLRSSQQRRRVEKYEGLRVLR